MGGFGILHVFKSSCLLIQLFIALISLLIFFFVVVVVLLIYQFLRFW